MKRQRFILMFRGIGIGFILAAILFFSIEGVITDVAKKEMTDSEIIEKAKYLGMIPITRVEDVYLTEEEVIEKAQELGMEFVDQ